MGTLTLKNPFLAQKLDDTVSLPPGDVPELHVKVLEKCRTALVQSRQSSQSIGLLVVGEAGSGKSRTDPHTPPVRRTGRVGSRDDPERIE